jgi:hypothetical protein
MKRFDSTLKEAKVMPLDLGTRLESRIGLTLAKGEAG